MVRCQQENINDPKTLSYMQTLFTWKLNAQPATVESPIDVEAEEQEDDENEDATYDEDD